MKFKKGDAIVCLDVPRLTDRERGYAIYPGEVYIAAEDSYTHRGEEHVELELNGDSEPYTCYGVKFFERVNTG